MDDPLSGFLRRVFASAAVIGDYLYVDGGEVARLIDGKTQNPPSAQVNTTLSLSLKSAWTNSTLKWIQTPRTNVLKLKDGAFWTDLSTKSFYAWAGQTSYSATPPPDDLWKFTADNAGSGSWSQVTIGDVVSFGALVKPSLCASASTANRVGYCIGGAVNHDTDTSISSSKLYPIPGVVAFDMDARKFSNRSSDGLGTRGTTVGARAEAVPFGPSSNSSGLLVLLGGADDAASANQVSFATLPIYDPAQGKWFSQATTGSRPAPSEHFCSVGARGDNGTYEIFLYGGYQASSNSILSDVYILSLPGFVFFKAPASALSSPRADHSCAVDGRQMFSVGGTVGTKGFPKSLTDPDPWTQGIGIYDMTDLQWTAGFDAKRPAYRTPDMVRQWYDQGGLKAVSWSSDAVKSLFLTSSTSDSVPSATSSPSDPASTSTPAQSSAPSAAQASQHPSTDVPIGTIVGGAVGGVALLAIIVALAVFFMLRRRRRRRRQMAAELVALPPPEKSWYGSGVHEAMSPPSAFELPGAAGHPSELDVPPAEMYAGHGRQELSSLGYQDHHGWNGMDRPREP